MYATAIWAMRLAKEADRFFQSALGLNTNQTLPLSQRQLKITNVSASQKELPDFYKVGNKMKLIVSSGNPF